MAKKAHVLDFLIILAGLSAMLLGVWLALGLAARVDTTLLFVSGGLGLLFLSLGWNRAGGVLGLASLTIGAAALFPDWFDLDGAVEQIFLRHFMAGEAIRRAPMDLLTANAGILSGAGISILGFSSSGKYRISLAGLASAGIMGIATFALISFIGRMETLWEWRNFSNVLARSASGFLILGIGVMGIAWREEKLRKAGSTEWMPASLVLSVMIVTALTWQGMEARGKTDLEQRLTRETVKIQKKIEAHIRLQCLALLEMARNWKVSDRGLPKKRQLPAGQSYLSSFDGYAAAEWIERPFRVIWIVPWEGKEIHRGINLRSDAIQGLIKTAVETKSPFQMSPTFDLENGEKAFLIYAPVYGQRPAKGVLVMIGVFHLEGVMENLLGENIDKGYSVVLEENGRVIYGREEPYPRLGAGLTLGAKAYLPGRIWNLTVSPGRRILAGMERARASVLVYGGFLALILALVFAFIERTRFQAREIAATRKSLGEEVAERKRIEESRQQLAAIVEFSDDPIIGTGLDGRITSWNRGAQRLFGYSLEEMHGQSLSAIIPADDEPGCQEIFVRVRTDGAAESHEGAWVKQSGALVDVSFTVSPIRGGDGKIAGLSVIARDVSERKRAEAELARQARELERSNEELEHFAHIASHDLHEPLRMIASYVELLDERYRPLFDDNARKYMSYLREGAVRSQQLLDDLLRYARVGTQGKPFEWTDCNAVLDSVLVNLKVAVEESGVKISRGNLPQLMADPVQLGQLFQNLISNAIKFRASSAPEVRVEAEPKKREWVFSVRDNGIGIDPKYAEKIFVIFQRLHSRRQYPGSGIGLAICKKIVERHGGNIRVESRPGDGSVFYFTIPASHQMVLTT
jgi:PAS domain S-box-containing protein